MPIQTLIGLINPTVKKLAMAGAVAALGCVGARAEPDRWVSADASLAVPQPAPRAMRAVSQLPQPLDAEDVGRYRRIFALQAQGDWDDANQEIRGLHSKILMGHVLFQRYMHPTAYRANYPELAQWLRQYRGLPGAYRVYSLASKRQPEGAAKLTLPVYGREHLRHLLGEAKTAPTLSNKATYRARAQEIRSRIARGHLSIATRMIDQAGLPPAASDRLRAQVALGWLALGEAAKAQTLAGQAAERSRKHTSVPDWVAGLAAFAKADYPAAVRYFGLHADSAMAGEWNKAAGAFWAARSEAKLNHRPAVRKWLETAARYPLTFYGQLALEALRRPLLPKAAQRPATAGDVARLQALPSGKRLFALIQVGQVRRADEELLQVLSKADRPLARSIMAIGAMAKLPQAAMRGGFYLANLKEHPPAAVLYPTPDWQPQGGFAVDQALLWAFVRQESVFNPFATSSAGARGLMQLMPATANYVAGEDRFEGAHRDALYNPSLNLALGQRYLRYLMDKSQISNDLFRLAVAYNAGIGNLDTWRREGVLARDPLMFIETLPLLETRLFVERVVANYWIYRAVMGQPRPSVHAVLKGQWPRYRSQESADVEIAEDVRNGHR
ncbi:MAG: transglycosylase SLT domain-containing protein [Alphaproteobacteria bacterium]|nr:transglycosylase SLT domain-containing protein [Alphaproteobacteria bacterium]